MESNSKVTDIFGIAPYGETIKLAVEKGFEGASALLSRICLPAAEELGSMLKDKMRYWKLNNVIKILNKANGKLTLIDGELQVHPRIVHEVMEGGSLCDDDTLQEMWAGLLAASCTTGAPKDDNILFVETLKQLSPTQALLINFICSKCTVLIHRHNLITGEVFHSKADELYSIVSDSDLEKLDVSLDNLCYKGLIADGGFQTGTNPLIAELTPTSYLLSMYVRTQGYRGHLLQFYEDRMVIDPMFKYDLKREMDTGSQPSR